MKKNVGVWIDTQKAIIVTLIEDEKRIKTIESSIENRIYHEHEGDRGVMAGAQAINREKIYDERKKHQVKQYIEEVLDELSHADAIFVFGPAEMKIRLKDAIDSHLKLKENLKGVETADSMTLNQVVAQVRTFFQ